MTILERAKQASIEGSKRSLQQDFKSFEEVYKTSYSHGLEAIYSLETIDLRTVKRIDPFPQSKPEVFKSKNDSVFSDKTQTEFNLGSAFTETMDSFVLEEPIKVLGLSRYAERSLYAQGVSVVQELIKTDLSQYVYLKGMGQGHIDEIEQRLKEYLKDTVLYQCQTIDFSAWVRSLFSTFTTKRMYVLSEPFHLSQLYTLTPAESVEVRLLTYDKRQEWCREMLGELESKRSQLVKGIGRVVAAFIKPWMTRRWGMTTRQEIVERLQRLADKPEIVESTLDFFCFVYFANQFALDDWLINKGDGLYFVDSNTQERYEAVIEKAKTYFYKSGVHYGLFELVQLLAKEFARDWVDHSDEFIEKCLRMSTNFRVRKGENSRIIVRLA